MKFNTKLNKILSLVKKPSNLSEYQGKQYYVVCNRLLMTSHFEKTIYSFYLLPKLVTTKKEAIKLITGDSGKVDLYFDHYFVPSLDEVHSEDRVEHEFLIHRNKQKLKSIKTISHNTKDYKAPGFFSSYGKTYFQGYQFTCALGSYLKLIEFTKEGLYSVNKTLIQPEYLEV